MLYTVLMVLKIIGIVLLCILGLLLLAVMLVLFVPVRYKGNALKANGEANPLHALAGVSWLLHILSADYEYNGGKTDLRIRIFGIRLRSREEREERRRKRKEAADKRKNKKPGKTEKRKIRNDDDYTIYEYNENGDEIISKPGDIEKRSGKTRVHVEEHEEGLDIEGMTEHAAPDRDDEKTNTLSCHDANEEMEAVPCRDTDDMINAEHQETGDDEELSKTERLAEAVHIVIEKAGNAAERIGGSCEKTSKLIARTGERVSGLIDNIDYYHTALFNDSQNREVIELLYKKAGRLVKAVRPRKVSGYLDFGFEDPSTTGKVLSVAAVLYPWYGRNFAVNPDFTDERLGYELDIKGRIYLCVVAKILVQLYFNKKVKRFIRIMKKESNSNG